tara:strand:- start:306 stop:1502 length:1197 start_codon:yes stop_codon:yes gene_type:complete
MFLSRRITMVGDVFRDEFSLAFDGTNDFIQLPMPINYSAVTISAWIKVTEDSNTKVIVGARDSSSDGLIFFLDSSERLVLRVNGQGTSTTGMDITPNVWTHVVGTYDGDKAIAYINTIASSPKDISTDGITTVTSNARIGRNAQSSANPYNGNISEIAIYDKALSASEIKTLYNGREPYNHKEGICSSNLKAWYRMGDGSANNRRFQYIENSASSAGSNIIMSSTFDSDEDGWEDYASGTVARSTDISSHSGSAGVLKCTTDATNNWLGKTTNITSGMESGKIYLVEAYVYIPSSWSGTSDMYIYTADQFGDANTNIGINSYNEAQDTIKDAWQRVFYTFLCQEDSGSGAIYLRTAGTSGLENGDFVYLDDFKITEIDKLSSGVLLNMAPEDFEGDSF